MLLELEDKAGGNSISGKNEFSSYPFGAHYLTQPNPGNTGLIDFLKQKGIITKEEGGKLFYEETALCFDPEERLFLKGRYQEGLIPSEMITDEERYEIKRFFDLIGNYRQMKGTDGKFIFDVPISFASADKTLDHLDEITFKNFLDRENFTSEYLLWYLDYCCRDDFGGGISKVSAWAGIHYFAGRRSAPGNTDTGKVITWPEGNDHLVKLLLNDVHEKVRTSCLVSEVQISEGRVITKVTDYRNRKNLIIYSEACILAVPPKINKYILHPVIKYPFQSLESFSNAPWLVAAVTLRQMPEARGMPLCWDNVAYGTQALGYIYNQHQQLHRKQTATVISLYIPLDEGSQKAERAKARERKDEEWKSMVLTELELMHEGISEEVEEIELWVWGHGMVLPVPGLLKSGRLRELNTPIDNKLFFAHSDLSGYSTFEEGFDQGCNAAKSVMRILS